MGCGIHSRRAYIVESKVNKEDLSRNDVSNLQHPIISNVNLGNFKIVNDESHMTKSRYFIDKEFVIENTEISEADMKLIKDELLKSFLSLEVIRLRNVSLASHLDIFECLAQSKVSSLRSLEISNVSQANSENIESHLYDVIERNPLIESITFRNLHFTKLNLAVMIFEKFQGLSALKELSLSKMLITSSMIVAIPATIQCLYLENIDIQESDINLLLDHLKNFQQIRKLSIVNTILQYSNISSIISHIYLEEIHIVNCEVNNSILTQMCKEVGSIEQSRLKKLNLSNNFLTDEAIGSLIHLLNAYKTLVIEVINNEISKEDVDKIQDNELRKRILI